MLTEEFSPSIHTIHRIILQTTPSIGWIAWFTATPMDGVARGSNGTLHDVVVEKITRGMVWLSGYSDGWFG